MVFATSAILCWGQKSTKIDQKSIQKRLPNPCSNLDGFWCQLGSILGGFWAPRWGQVGTKSRSKAIFKSMIKMMPRSFQKQLSNQHPNLHRFGTQLGSSLGGFWGPRWGQVGTKSLQKSIFKSIKKMIIFLIALGTDFDRFWAPTWGIWGGQSSPFSDHLIFFFGVLGRSWLQDGGLGLHLGSHMEPKIHENCFQERSKRWSFFWSIWRSIFGAIWCQLGSILTPKTHQK